MRFITNQGPRSHVGQYERSQIGYLSVDDRVKFLRLCHSHKIFYNISAPYLHDNFVRVTEVHRYNTRSSSFNFRVPNVKGAASSTFFNCAIHDWNSLPKEIKRIKKSQPIYKCKQNSSGKLCSPKGIMLLLYFCAILLSL